MSKARLCLVLIIGFSGCLFFLMNNPYLTVVNIDSAIFCLLGKALAQGQGYALLSEPNPQPYFTFPPLLPLQLAALMKLTGSTDLLALQGMMKGYVQILFLFSLPLFYRWLRSSLTQPAALALTALLAVNPIVFKYSSDVLSDAPYWFFSIAALWGALQWHQRQQQEGRNAFLFFGLTLVFIVLAALTRQIGMALAAAFCLSLLLQRQWKAALVAGAVFAACIGSWQSYEHFYRLQHPVEGDALNQAGVAEVLKDSPVKLEFVKHFLVVNPVSEDKAHVQQGLQELLNNVLTRLERYSEITLDQFLPPLSIRLAGAKQNLFHLFPFLVLLWGVFLLGFKRFHQAFPLGALYLLGYAGILLVYPYISPRFLLPLFPLILVSLYLGLQTLQQGLATRPQQVLQRVALGIMPVFFCMTLLGGHLPQTLRWVNAGYSLKQAQAGPSKRPGNLGYYRSVVWIKDHTAPDSLVISRKPPVTYFYSERKSLAFPFTQEPQRLLAYLQEKQQFYQGTFKTLYVLEDTAFQESTRYLTPFIQQNAAHFTLVYRDALSGAKVWRFIP